MGIMSANGISHLPNKRARQDVKLAYSEAKRKGQIITEGNGSWVTDGIDNPAANWYRTRNTLDIDQLPTVYDPASNNSKDVIDNDPTGGLIVGRPWT